MRVIDANTGIEPRIGIPFRNVHGQITLLDVEEGVFSARGLFRYVDAAGRPTERWVPLQVRWTHPAFFGRKVAFIPS